MVIRSAFAVRLKRVAIFVHRWVGVALCAFFLLWFPSGIGIMYWDYPSVVARDRLERSPALDPATVRLSAEEAYERMGGGPLPPGVRLNTFDGRPVYRFAGEGIVYADTGEVHGEVSPELMLRVAAAWTGQPAGAARVESVEEVDQWTVGGVFRYRPLTKYTWPNGEQVYVEGNFGEVVQYTTTSSRLGAYLGPIPHWFYFTPLRKHALEWNRVVVWSAGIGAFTALLGVVIGVWMYSPSKRYRNRGVATSIPYRGQKRWHAVFGLIFGVAAVTWAFSGMLSVEPFPLVREVAPAPAGERIVRTLETEADMAAFAAQHPREALERVPEGQVKQLELTAVAGNPVYLATLPGADTYIVPLEGDPLPSIDVDRLIELVSAAAGPGALAEIRVVDQYDAYYLDRRRERPLPVVLARLNDAAGTRFYINPKTARVIETYHSGAWMNRWLYHGLHSLNFPWLYNHRPLWDIIVITFMVGGTALCVTSAILAWRVIGRTIGGAIPGAAGSHSELSDDLVVEADA